MAVGKGERSKFILISFFFFLPSSLFKDPYGTLREAWKALLVEADAQADVHTSTEEKLLNTCASDVQNYKKENYSKRTLSLAFFFFFLLVT